MSLDCISLPKEFVLCCGRCPPVPNAVHPAPGTPHLSISAQPAAASLLQGTGWPRDTAAPRFPPHSCFGQISPAAERFLLFLGFYVCPQGGGHDLHISQPAQKISIKTRIIRGSGHGPEKQGGKREEIFVCQRQQQKKVLVAKKVLSVWFVTCVAWHTTELQCSSL